MNPEDVTTQNLDREQTHQVNQAISNAWEQPDVSAMVLRALKSAQLAPVHAETVGEILSRWWRTQKAALVLLALWTLTCAAMMAPLVLSLTNRAGPSVLKVTAGIVMSERATLSVWPIVALLVLTSIAASLALWFRATKSGRSHGLTLMLTLLFGIAATPGTAFAEAMPVSIRGCDGAPNVTLQSGQRLSETLGRSLESSGWALIFQGAPIELSAEVRNAPLSSVMSVLPNGTSIWCEGTTVFVRSGASTSSSLGGGGGSNGGEGGRGGNGGGGGGGNGAGGEGGRGGNGGSVPSPQRGEDAIAFGGDVLVPLGETANDVASFGGDATVDGTVLGDVFSAGGDVLIRGSVRGDVVSLGGDVTIEPGAEVLGEIDAVGGQVRGVGHTHGGVSQSTSGGRVRHHRSASHGSSWLGSFMGGFMFFLLVFIAGMLALGGFPNRLSVMQASIIKAPLSTFGYGMLSVIAVPVALITVAITIVGLPLALVSALLVPLAIPVAAAIIASIVGAMLPLTQLGGRPILQLGVGVLLVFLCSWVPMFGPITFGLALILGFGAMWRTRLGAKTLVEDPAEPFYRTAG